MNAAAVRFPFSVDPLNLTRLKRLTVICCARFRLFFAISELDNLLTKESRMHNLVLLLLWTLAASAQTVKLEEPSSIEGRVLNAITGEPVGKASLL